MKSIAVRAQVLALVSFLVTLAGCASQQVVQPATEVSVLAPEMRAIVPPSDEMEMQINEPVRKEKKAAPELADRVAPEKIGKPSITAQKVIVAE
jgi:outer membrane murein-binding lipoprotein Lpp